MAMASSDGGRTWTRPRRLPDEILGPIRAKPVLLDSNTLLAGSSTEDGGWRVHIESLRIIGSSERATSERAGNALNGRATNERAGNERTTNERTTNGGATSHGATNDVATNERAPSDAERWIAWVASAEAWTKTPPLNTPDEFGAIQPTILVHGPARLQILCRTQQRVIAESWSSDGGTTWSAMKATQLPNPSAGIDTVRLADGRFVLAYNPSPDNRRSLALAISSDGVAWSAPMIVEEGPGEYSYPAIIATDDGLVHLTYTWRRERIRHVVVKVD
jgi:hypothetical protein